MALNVSVSLTAAACWQRALASNALTICSSRMRFAACLAASPSSSATTRKASSNSEILKCATSAPRLTLSVTSRVSTSCLMASRTGVRDTPNSSANNRSRSRSPGLSSRFMMRASISVAMSFALRLSVLLILLYYPYLCPSLNQSS